MKSLVSILIITVTLSLACGTAAEIESSQQVALGDKAKTEATALLLKKCFEEYRLTSGTYPTTKQGLGVLVDLPHRVAPDEPTPKRWRQILKKLPNDAWGNPFSYTVKKQDGSVGYELRSFGKDGKKSDDDIIVRWKEKAKK